MAVQQFYEKEANQVWPKKTKVALDVPQKGIERGVDGLHFLLVRAVHGKTVAAARRHENEVRKVARAQYQASKSRFGHPKQESIMPEKMPAASTKLEIAEA